MIQQMYIIPSVLDIKYEIWYLKEWLICCSEALLSQRATRSRGCCSSRLVILAIHDPNLLPVEYVRPQNALLSLYHLLELSTALKVCYLGNNWGDVLT